MGSRGPTHRATVVPRAFLRCFPRWAAFSPKEPPCHPGERGRVERSTAHSSAPRLTREGCSNRQDRPNQVRLRLAVGAKDGGSMTSQDTNPNLTARLAASLTAPVVRTLPIRGEQSSGLFNLDALYARQVPSSVVLLPAPTWNPPVPAVNRPGPTRDAAVLESRAAPAVIRAPRPSGGLPCSSRGWQPRRWRRCPRPRFPDTPSCARPAPRRRRPSPRLHSRRPPQPLQALHRPRRRRNTARCQWTTYSGWRICVSCHSAHRRGRRIGAIEGNITNASRRSRWRQRADPWHQQPERGQSAGTRCLGNQSPQCH